MGLMRFPPPTYQISGGLNLPALDPQLPGTPGSWAGWLQLAYIGTLIHIIPWDLCLARLFCVPSYLSSPLLFLQLLFCYLHPMRHAAVVR